MSSIAKTYLKNIRRNLGYRATWEPNVSVELGAYGIFSDHRFLRLGHVTELIDVELDVAQGPAGGEMKYVSKKGVQITVKVAGQVLPGATALAKADAGVAVAFENSKGVVFQAKNTQNSKINNLGALQPLLYALYQEGKWNKNYVLIAEVIVAEATTILVSSSSSSKVELRAAGELKSGGVEGVDLTADVGAAFSKDLSVELIGAPGLTPLYKAVRLKREFLGGAKPVFEPAETIQQRVETTLPDLLEEIDENSEILLR